MDIRVEIQKLYNCRLLKTEEEFEQFENTLERLADYNDESIIRELCTVFDDNTEDEEVMFGLIHFIESVEKEVYLTDMPKALPNMIENAKEWAMILNKRILNHELYRKEYMKILSNMDEPIKLTVVNLLTEIAADNPERFQFSVNEIIQHLN
ncbi:Imm30 family immunity protein [Priestia endophytica]|uniref:Imm30 family immunity protein n=1 Tax=Priestia endophytica TaxID=135735 RepID=UPI00227EFCF8|nr:Imm30 family immunity protein [Priestia endophytica]MCY8232238.1 Imm30 family immunity protein [Priestia endophytica]